MDTEKLDAALTAMAASAPKLTVTGALMTSVGGLTDNQIAVYGGLVIAVTGLLLQAVLSWWFQHRRDLREAEARAEERKEHALRAQALTQALEDSAANDDDAGEGDEGQRHG